MNGIPTIHATNCPSVEELALRFSIVYAHFACNPLQGGIGDLYVGHLGRIVDDGEEDGWITLCDPFSFHSGPQITGDRRNPQIGWDRLIFPFDGFDVEKVRLCPKGILACVDLSPAAVTALREKLIPAWDGRDELRRKGGRVQLAGSLSLVP